MTTTFERFSLALLRFCMGFLFFYAGITKILDPNWTAAGYIQGAKNFTWFYELLLHPSVLPVVNFVNEWGLTLLGLSLIFGIFVRLSSLLGVVLMLMYYFVLDFPYPNPHALIVDEHIIYAAALLFFAAARAGRTWGLEQWCQELPICRQFPALRRWLG